MTSVIPVGDRKIRVKGQINDKPGDDETTRAFLNFSRENLSVSHSDIEQGFNRHNSRCLKIKREMILSILAIFLAIVCLVCEGIKIKKIVDNSRDIESIKVDLESLKQRIYGENFFDELRAFEQLYADEEEDLSETDLDEDYDSNYDDYETSHNNYPNDYETTSSIKSDQSTIASGLIKEEKKKNVFGIREHFQKGFEKNKTISRHVKRFVAEEPQNAHIHDKTPSQPSISSKDTRKTTKKNYLLPASIIFDKSHYENHQRNFHKKKMSRMTKAMTTRGMTRRHVRPSRQIFAAHYGADSTKFDDDDEHTGNGRARHNEGIFKAWRGSDWMNDLDMNRHFSLARDGRLTVHETGLYLVYAQIHYLDEHDENGFHLIVNGQPILQCMVYSPGNGHKSRSCFSAQVTYLASGDRIVVKEVGPARYTLFQADKSFFGLAKIGDIRQPQQNQTRHNIQTTPYQ